MLCGLHVRPLRPQARLPDRPHHVFAGLAALQPGATASAQLIAFRAVQGLGASMLNPVALSIIANVFPDPKARARAVGIWGAVAGVSLALGPLLGGALTQTVGWRSIFWINLPIWLGGDGCWPRSSCPSRKLRKRAAFDPVGQALVFGTLASLTYAVIEGPRAGWHLQLIRRLVCDWRQLLLAALRLVRAAARDAACWTCASFAACRSAAPP